MSNSTLRKIRNLFAFTPQRGIAMLYLLLFAILSYLLFFAITADCHLECSSSFRDLVGDIFLYVFLSLSYVYFLFIGIFDHSFAWIGLILDILYVYVLVSIGYPIKQRSMVSKSIILPVLILLFLPLTYLLLS